MLVSAWHQIRSVILEESSVSAAASTVERCKLNVRLNALEGVCDEMILQREVRSVAQDGLNRTGRDIESRNAAP